jgi:hypothetical protein
MVDTTTLPEPLAGFGGAALATRAGRPLTHPSIFESRSAGRRPAAAENSDAEVPR